MLSHLEHLQVGELQFAKLLQTFLEDTLGDQLNLQYVQAIFQ